MIRTSSRLLLRWLGWTVKGSLPGLTKYVIILAPHRSKWDFFAGKLYLMSMGVKPSILIKHELFFFPLGYIMRSLGGIAVDRSKRSHTVEAMAALFNASSHFILAITPEGTRQKNASWKTGFYYIAVLSGVPIVPAYCDVNNRILCIDDAFYPTGNATADIDLLNSKYSSFAADRANF